MLKTISAYTLEIDDPDMAAEEILAGLDPEHNLLKNSLAIIACHQDYISSGAVSAICSKLPCPSLGGTTLASGAGGSADLSQLTVFVLTSDDLSFSVLLTEPVPEDPSKCIRAAYAQGCAALSAKPSLILAYIAYNAIRVTGGQSIVTHLSRASGGVPVFGTACCDDNADLRESAIIYNGQAYMDRVVLAFIHGALEPEFYTVTIPTEKIYRQTAIITDSDGCLLKSINDIPALTYLESMGIGQNNTLLKVSTMHPLVVDYNDGSAPLARGVYSVTPEGWLLCGGDMPQGAGFSLGYIDAEAVLNSAGQSLDVLLTRRPASGLLLVSCLTRGLALGSSPLAEAEKIEERIKGRLPYLLCYSGGEVCPSRADGGVIHNHFHNFSLVACLL